MLVSHSFRISEELRASIEVPLIPGGVHRTGLEDLERKDIVKENQRLVKSGGFELPHAGWQSLPPPPKTDRIQCPAEEELAPARFQQTEVCVANTDTLSAALILGEALALNFANAHTPGGGYLTGARAQEEELCRLLPQLHPSLKACRYPIRPGEALLTQGLAAVRTPSSRQLCPTQGEVNIVTAAMPQYHDARPGTPAWFQTVSLRIRAVLHAAKCSGLPNLVLGAFGCGAFGNPPAAVATLFRQHLESPEFRGCFQRVVFAIIDPKKKDGNLAPFQEEMGLLDSSSSGKDPTKNGYLAQFQGGSSSGAGQP